MSISILKGRLIDPAHGIDDILDLHIDGDISLTLLPSPRVEVAAIRYPNVAGGSANSMLEIAKIAAEVNSSMENIGARRLHTVLEKVLDELSFEAPDIGK